MRNAGSRCIALHCAILLLPGCIKGPRLLYRVRSANHLWDGRKVRDFEQTFAVGCIVEVYVDVQRLHPRTHRHAHTEG